MTTSTSVATITAKQQQQPWNKPTTTTKTWCFLTNECIRYTICFFSQTDKNINKTKTSTKQKQKQNKSTATATKQQQLNHQTFIPMNVLVTHYASFLRMVLLKRKKKTANISTMFMPAKVWFFNSKLYT